MPNHIHANVESVAASLAAVGQEHVLKHWNQLTDQQRSTLLAQIREIDWVALPALVDRYVKTKPEFHLPKDVKPAKYFPNNPDSPIRRWDKQGARARGEALIRAGKVAAFVVAGGQGSRLGFEGPKGCFPAGAVSRKPLFQMFAEQLVATGRRYQCAAPAWYIMTSPLNHRETVSFFEQHGHFGLKREDIMFFPQGVMPSLDIRTGRVLMSSKFEIATNPDGHGGAFKALSISGALADMRRRSIEHVSYFQVDNPIVRIIDPVFIGLHADPAQSSGEMSSKMIPKAYPGEKLGVFCEVGGKVEVIEYSDLPMSLQEERLADGSLRFGAGSIAIHMLGAAFVERVNNDRSFALPYHRADKRVPCLDITTGEMVGGAAGPKENNGVKLERFVFDALPKCRASIVYQTDRVEEFAPIKNATGVDSPETSRQIQTERAARWLKLLGVDIPRDSSGSPLCTIEIAAGSALEASDLQRPDQAIVASDAVIL